MTLGLETPRVTRGLKRRLISGDLYAARARVWIIKELHDGAFVGMRRMGIFPSHHEPSKGLDHTRLRWEGGCAEAGSIDIINQRRVDTIPGFTFGKNEFTHSRFYTHLVGTTGCSTGCGHEYSPRMTRYGVERLEGQTRSRRSYS